MLIPCRWASGDNVWIGFWGSYLGAILSASAAFYILHVQRKDNINENEQNRQLQLSVLKYQQKIVWLNDLRNALADNVATYNANNLIEILAMANRKEPYVLIESRFKELLNELIRTDTIAGMLMPDPQDECLKEFNKQRAHYFIEYCSAIKDLQIITVIMYHYSNLLDFNSFFPNRKYYENASNELREIIENVSGANIPEETRKYRDRLMNALPNRFEDFRNATLSCLNEEQREVNMILQDIKTIN